MMRLLTVKQFEMQIAPRFVGETLKKLARESEPEGTGHVLSLFSGGNTPIRQAVQPAPNQVGASAEINNTPRQTLVHWHVGFARKRVPRVEASPVAANALLIAEGMGDCLAQRDAA